MPLLAGVSLPTPNILAESLQERPPFPTGKSQLVQGNIMEISVEANGIHPVDLSPLLLKAVALLALPELVLLIRGLANIPDHLQQGAVPNRFVFDRSRLGEGLLWSLQLMDRHTGD
jgi:hypothetical protein